MPGSKLPVMFWIFGGYFQAGNNAWWAYGPDNWVERGVVLVQPNHRLGPFGFTDLGIPEAPGNQGMMVMMMVMMMMWPGVAGPGGGAGVDQHQHREVRGRPRECDHPGRVLGQLGSLLPPLHPLR